LHGQYTGNMGLYCAQSFCLNESLAALVERQVVTYNPNSEAFLVKKKLWSFFHITLSFRIRKKLTVHLNLQKKKWYRYQRQLYTLFTPSVQLSLFQGRKTAKIAVGFAEQKNIYNLSAAKKTITASLQKFSIILYLKTEDHQKWLWWHLLESLVYSSHYQNQTKQQPGSIWNRWFLNAPIV
jgi:hypothetical protein